ncbi:cyclic nucleotide-binding domain-containing protein [Vibrio astriarenae]|uniref:Cyclic nucleotide-binding domain-containing protein n=1 Tax=Vibrio astriarenae TaxID=1481923 RepID=A0A7Z2YG07_9VIBR|nr:Crp/Fnr family transcriptional regulator [Vibrio astriarenae]QIA66092.1 cyclic nucleotide-binding domain-containing protein [Vibrio astriarenae]
MQGYEEFQKRFEFSPELRNALFENAQYQTFEAGEEIIAQGDTLDSIGFVLEGVLTGNRGNYDGVERMIGLVGAGDIYAETGLFHTTKAFCTFQAVTDCTVLVVPNQVIETIDNKLEMMEFLFWSQSKKLQYTSMIHFASTERDKVIKVAAILEAIAHYSHLEDIPLTIEQLASFLGMSRNTVSKSLRELEKRGAVEIGKAGIRIKERYLLTIDGSGKKLF